MTRGSPVPRLSRSLSEREALQWVVHPRAGTLAPPKAHPWPAALPTPVASGSGLFPGVADSRGTHPSNYSEPWISVYRSNEIASPSLMAIRRERRAQREEINSHTNEFLN